MTSNSLVLPFYQGSAQMPFLISFVDDSVNVQDATSSTSLQNGFFHSFPDSLLSLSTNVMNPNLFFMSDCDGFSICLDWTKCQNLPAATSRNDFLGKILNRSWVYIPNFSESASSSLLGPQNVLALRLNAPGFITFNKATLTEISCVTTCGGTGSKVRVYRDATITGGPWAPVDPTSFAEFNNAPVVSNFGTLVYQGNLRLEQTFSPAPIYMLTGHNLLFVVDNQAAGQTDISVNWNEQIFAI